MVSSIKTNSFNSRVNMLCINRRCCECRWPDSSSSNSNNSNSSSQQRVLWAAAAAAADIMTIKL